MSGPLLSASRDALRAYNAVCADWKRAETAWLESECDGDDYASRTRVELDEQERLRAVAETVLTEAQSALFMSAEERPYVATAWIACSPAGELRTVAVIWACAPWDARKVAAYWARAMGASKAEVKCVFEDSCETVRSDDTTYD